MTETTVEAHAEGWCIHFTGVLNKTCKQGLSYLSMYDAQRRLPCILDDGSTTVCPYLTPPTPEQIAASEAQVQEALHNFFGAMFSGNCPRCGKPLEWERQVRRSVYGSCGCRLWQGKARSAEKLKELQAKAAKAADNA